MIWPTVTHSRDRPVALVQWISGNHWKSRATGSWGFMMLGLSWALEKTCRWRWDTRWRLVKDAEDSEDSENIRNTKTIVKHHTNHTNHTNHTMGWTCLDNETPKCESNMCEAVEVLGKKATWQRQGQQNLMNLVKTRKVKKTPMHRRLELPCFASFCLLKFGGNQMNRAFRSYHWMAPWIMNLDQQHVFILVHLIQWCAILPNYVKSTHGQTMKFSMQIKRKWTSHKWNWSRTKPLNIDRIWLLDTQIVSTHWSFVGWNMLKHVEFL